MPNVNTFIERSCIRIGAVFLLVTPADCEQHRISRRNVLRFRARERMAFGGLHESFNSYSPSVSSDRAKYALEGLCPTAIIRRWLDQECAECVIVRRRRTMEGKLGGETIGPLIGALFQLQGSLIGRNCIYSKTCDQHSAGMDQGVSDFRGYGELGPNRICRGVS